jgi:hypothetical protein
MEDDTMVAITTDMSIMVILHMTETGGIWSLRRLEEESIVTIMCGLCLTAPTTTTSHAMKIRMKVRARHLLGHLHLVL